MSISGHEAAPTSGLAAPKSRGLSEALDMACSSSSAVKGVSCAVIWFVRSTSVMSMPLSCWDNLVVGSVSAEGMAVGWSEREVFAVSWSTAVLAVTLLSLLVVADEPSSESAPLSVLKVDPFWLCHDGLLLAALLGTLLCALVPPGEMVPDRARELRLRAAEKASEREKAFRLA